MLHRAGVSNTTWLRPGTHTHLGDGGTDTGVHVLADNLTTRTDRVNAPHSGRPAAHGLSSASLRLVSMPPAPDSIIMRMAFMWARTIWPDTAYY